MGMLDKIKNMDATKVALGASLLQNAASAAENARLWKENENLSREKRRLEEVRAEERRQESIEIEQLIDSADAIIDSIKKRNRGLVDLCAGIKKRLSALLEIDIDLTVSCWLWAKEMLNLDAFMREENTIFPDERDQAYLEALNDYKQLDARIKNLESWKKVENLLHANEEANKLKNEIKDKCFSLDDVSFDDNMDAIWLELAMPSNPGWLARTGLSMIGAAVVSGFIKLFFGSPDILGSSGMPIFVIGVLCYIVSVFHERRAREIFLDTRKRFFRNFVQTWNGGIAEINQSIAKCENRRVTLKETLESALQFYSERIINNNPHLSAMRNGDNFKGLLGTYEIKDNIKFLSTQFPENDSVINEAFFLKKMRSKTAVALCDTKVTFLGVMRDVFCPRR